MDYQFLLALSVISLTRWRFLISVPFFDLQVFRKAKEFFDQPKINLVAGISIVKSENAQSNEVDIEAVNGVEARSSAIENFVVDRVSNFFQERQLSWNFANTARSLANAIPDDVKASVRSMVSEARGKKKILKQMMPILGIIKLKVVALGILALLGIGLVAKKALVVSLISIAISIFIFIKKLLAKKLSLVGGLGGHEESVPYHGGGGWQSGGGWNSYDPHYGGGDSIGHGSSIAHSLAYGGHHKA